MKFIPAFLLLILLVSSLSPAHGVLEAFNTNLKCRCTKTTSKLVSLKKKISGVQFWPPGNGCPMQEIIVTLKNKSTVCLNPKAEWVQSLLKRLWKNGNSAFVSPVPTKTQTA
ncbi:C-X-C motif chemokine 13 [Rousettus aegyptiacus]|uniref:C-X-C motif chemokine ligand 13 n=1 Tax=Rousettus aegyptiacus TaxID=9407 RepID=A0A7J8E6L0_ROUAE|nr:C-X-C motif chemokine 13 [Rousettus aegyptiacus]KAF6431043.1 C-X-C motif chemokine ligand 13 [Rousettus aegyptiacus]